MHAVKVDSRKIMAAGLVIVAVFAAVAITVNLFYLGQIQSLVRNTTTTSVMELATARARYLDECLTSDQNSVKSLAHFIADITPQEARDQVKDFISTHEAAAAWIRSKDGTTWCSSSETDLYDPALEDELFGPAMAGETGSSEMYLGHAGERRILFYAPIVDAPATAGPGTTTTPADPDDVLGAVYVSYPADELQNSYGTAYSSAGATFVVDSSGTIVLDANRGADEAVQGSLSALINDNADSAQVSSLLAGIASDTSGSLVMTLDGADQFVFYTPISAKSGWSLVTILPLSVVESDGTQIVGITNQMVAVLAVAVAVAAAAMVALMVYRRRREHRYEQYIQSVYSAIGANIDTAIFIVDRKERLIEAVFENIQDILGIPARDFFVPNELSPNEAYANVAAIVHSGAGDKARTWEFEADNPAHVRDYNRKIATSGQHLLGLINDVLDMSKIEAGKTTLAASAFALSGTVESVEAMMRQQTDAKNQVFTVEVDKVEHDRLVGDEGRLRQILMNLLSNAMKYTPEGGHILFRVDGSAKRHGKLQHLRIIVRDDGIGMSKDYLATIFDSFTREESSLTNKVQGTGLGMAITKNLVDLMGGTISVESELGTGSTFIVDLDFPPAGDESDGSEGGDGKRAGDASGTGGNALAHKHVLVAEDNALNAEVITAILNIHDATCEVAANGEEAVAKFGMSAPGTFDMIFVDVQMPVMNGHDAARAIRAMDRPDAGTIPIIAMTANAFAEDERQALACGMNAHVAKPIDVHALERVVAELS